MLIHDIRLLHFRNYDDERVTFPPSIVVLYGKNGQGKTNLLEALYMASIGKSYRGLADADLIQWKQQTASLILNFSRSGVIQQIKMILSKEAKKELWVNKTRVSRRELIGTLNEVLFSPEDLQLIKAGPALRRRFLDRELSQVSPVYCQTLLRYHRAVAQRNLLLKRMKYEKVQSLEEWDRQIASLAADIVQRRLQALHKIRLLARITHKRLSGGEGLDIDYVQPYGDGREKDAQWYYDMLQSHLEQDRYRMSTSVGPHRDDLEFSIAGANLKKYGSQGQQRTAVLALKLSELEYMKSETGEYPVLLLDDVMSELDSQRRQALLSFVKGRIQTFITTTEPDMFRSVADCSFICIEQGRVAANG